MHLFLASSSSAYYLVQFGDRPPGWNNVCVDLEPEEPCPARQHCLLMHFRLSFPKLFMTDQRPESVNASSLLLCSRKYAQLYGSGRNAAGKLDTRMTRFRGPSSWKTGLRKVKKRLGPHSGKAQGRRFAHAGPLLIFRSASWTPLLSTEFVVGRKRIS
jgi:hypothetical protein